MYTDDNITRNKNYNGRFIFAAQTNWYRPNRMVSKSIISTFIAHTINCYISGYVWGHINEIVFNNVLVFILYIRKRMRVFVEFVRVFFCHPSLNIASEAGNGHNAISGQNYDIHLPLKE